MNNNINHIQGWFFGWLVLTVDLSDLSVLQYDFEGENSMLLKTSTLNPWMDDPSDPQIYIFVQCSSSKLWKRLRQFRCPESRPTTIANQLNWASFTKPFAWRRHFYMHTINQVIFYWITLVGCSPWCFSPTHLATKQRYLPLSKSKAFPKDDSFQNKSQTSMTVHKQLRVFFFRNCQLPTLWHKQLPCQFPTFVILKPCLFGTSLQHGLQQHAAAHVLRGPQGFHGLRRVLRQLHRVLRPVVTLKTTGVIISYVWDQKK